MYKFNKGDGNGWDTIVTDFIKLSQKWNITLNLKSGHQYRITDQHHRHCLMQRCVMAISHAIYFGEREKVGSVLFLEKIGVRQNTKINWEQLPDLVDMGVNSSVSC